MSHILIIRLGYQATDLVKWWYRNGSGQETESIVEGELKSIDELSRLAEYAVDCEITILVPGDTVVLRNVEFSGKVNGKILKALPYLLEDTLAGNVEKLHLVLLEQLANQLHLMAVDRDTLRQWLSWLHDAGLTPQRLLPDVLALPQNSEGWSALQLGEQWIIRQDPWSGVVLYSDWLALLLADWQPLPPVLAYSDQLQLPAGWRRMDISGLAVLAKHPMSQLPNLLTGEFKPKRSNGGYRAWYLVSGLLLAWGLLRMIDIGVEGYRQQQRAMAFRQQSLVLYHEMVPEESKFNGNPRPRLQKQLNQLETQPIEPGLLELLEEAVPLFSQLQPLQVSSMNYNGAEGSLTVELKEVNLNRLKDLVKQQPFEFQLDIDNNTATDPAAKTRIVLRNKK